MFVIWVVLGVFLFWLAIALRKIHRGYASLAFILAVLMLGLSFLGFFKII
jgi:hypothetical protein